MNNKTNPTSISTFRARLVGQGYKQVNSLPSQLPVYLCVFSKVISVLLLYQVCGQADVWGDGVVPEISAHLEGALNISLDNVYHSPVGSEDALRPWYGSPAIVEKWVHHLLN